MPRRSRAWATLRSTSRNTWPDTQATERNGDQGRQRHTAAASLHSKGVMAEEEIGGYRFRDPALLGAALTHSSYLHEHTDEETEDFERLEFLGDAVVDLVIGELLYRSHPEATEGELTAMRAQLVSGPPLAQLAQ